MKKYIQILICVIALIAITFLPEVQDFLFTSNISVEPLTLAFTPLLWNKGRENMGGYKNRVLWVPDEAVTTVPSLPKKQTTDEDLVTASGAFTFKEEGKKPMFIYCTDKTVKYGAENQGETDSQSYRQNGEFFFPGSRKEAHIFNRKVNNTPGYLILEDTEGEQIMVGQKGLPCTIKPSFDGGQARTDRRGTKYDFEADSFCTAVILGTPIDLDALDAEEANNP